MVRSENNINGGGGIMQMSEVCQRAEVFGLKPGKRKKADLIHAIQDKEGYEPCFQTGRASCDQLICCWRSDCLVESSLDRNKRESFLQAVKAELKEFNSKIEGLKMKADAVVGKKRTAALADIKKLEKRCEEEIKQKLHNLSAASEDVWQSTKNGIESSWKELRKASGNILRGLGKAKTKEHGQGM
jgi:hypothetical protein